MSEDGETEEEKSDIVKFGVAASSTRKTGDVYKVVATLEASVSDLKVWEKVLNKLRDLEVSAGNTLVSETVDMLKDKLKETEVQLVEMTERYRIRDEEAKSRESLMATELQRLRGLEKRLENLAGLEVRSVVD